MNTLKSPVKALVGLGNPGNRYAMTRHNVGFLVLDALGQRYGAIWKEEGNALCAFVVIGEKKIVLVKPQTFMNASGAVMPALHKRGIEAASIVVVHDELEFPFGKLAFRSGGSARGHNGLKSIIERIGHDFERLRCGIGRPERKEDVPAYVLQNFSESENDISRLVDQAADMLEKRVMES